VKEKQQANQQVTARYITVAPPVEREENIRIPELNVQIVGNSQGLWQILRAKNSSEELEPRRNTIAFLLIIRHCLNHYSDENPLQSPAFKEFLEAIYKSILHRIQNQSKKNQENLNFEPEDWDKYLTENNVAWEQYHNLLV